MQQDFLAPISIRYRTNTSQRIMGPVVVIVQHPLRGNIPYLVQRIEDVCVQHLLPVGPVEPFYQSVLCRFPRLCIFELDPVCPAPVLGKLGNEFRTVVHPYPFRFAVAADQVS